MRGLDAKREAQTMIGRGGVAIAALLVLAVSLVFIPIPLHTDDGGWIWGICGSLVDKPVIEGPVPDMQATSCELAGAYRRRVSIIGATLGAGLVVGLIATLRASCTATGTATTRDWRRLGAAAVAMAAVVSILWLQNDRTSAGYPFAPIGAAVERGADGGSTTLRFRGFGWVRGVPVEITGCEVPPEQCDHPVATIDAVDGDFDVVVERALQLSTFLVSDGVRRQWIVIDGPTLDQIRTFSDGG